MTQAGEIKQVGHQYRDHGEYQQEQPLGGSVAGGSNLPRRVHKQPEKRRPEQYIDEDAPVIMPREQVVPGNVVEGESKGSRHRRSQSPTVHVEAPSPNDSDS